MVRRWRKLYSAISSFDDYRRNKGERIEKEIACCSRKSEKPSISPDSIFEDIEDTSYRNQNSKGAILKIETDDISGILKAKRTNSKISIFIFHCFRNLRIKMVILPIKRNIIR